jgi:hypothetical protein
MRRITAIPSKKITFHNVPISALFFLKRTLYKKISVREANKYNDQEQIYFEPNEIVRYIAKQHEPLAIELYDTKLKEEPIDDDYEIDDTVEIIKKEVLGKIVSVNKTTCLVQYKNKTSVTFDEFPKQDLKKI